ncbi:MAG: InlB B-repeat-containing protein [Bacilli bacterium]|nr:InlB B-repeat-containing protein [Bacilli bacterium]
MQKKLKEINEKMQKKLKIIKNSKGFSLIELLATIFLISLTLGAGITFVINTINKSKEKSQLLAINNIKKTANTYIEEYPDEIAWIKENDSDNSFSCISINSLINKGYITEKEVSSQEGISKAEYVLINRDQSKNIINREVDENNKCSKTIQKVEIPTAKKYCNTIYYNGNEQQLVTSSNDGFTIEQSQIKKTEVGNYDITAKLNQNDPVNHKTYIWSDDTISDKTFTCTIKKQEPELNIIGSQGENGESLDDTKINLKSNVPGTIQVKSSDKSIATASFDTDDKIDANSPKSVTIKKHATKSPMTYITFTLTPTDAKNYAQTTTVYTIGKVELTTVDKPKCNQDLYYNFEYQHLINPSKQYNLLNSLQKEAGEYTVTAKLKYGYIWKDDKSTNDYQTTCKIENSKFQLSYDDNGGSGCSNQKRDIYYRQTYGTLTTLCIPSRTGYSFNGWNSSKSGSGKNITNDTIVSSKNNQTIYAQWKANTYTVKYNGNGNTSGNTANSSHTYDVSKRLTANGFYRTGYTFNGWNTSSNGYGTNYYNQQSVINLTAKNGATFNLYAKWQINTYTLTYNNNGGSGCSSKTLNYNDYYDLSCTPYRSGYSFDGWYTSPSGGYRVYSSYRITQNTTVYAQWTAIPTVTYYYLYFNSNGGSYCQTKTLEYNDYYDLSCTPYRSGYSFDGWYTSSSGGYRVYSSDRITQSTTVYAHWTADSTPSPTYYYLYFDSNGGSYCQTKTLEYNDYYDLSCTPSKNGYSFDGWYTSSSGGSRVYSSDRITQSTTVYAHWTANSTPTPTPTKYTLTYNNNGGSGCSSKTLNYNDYYDLSCTPSRSGYTFDGWYTSSSGGSKVSTSNKITKDTTIYAHWTANPKKLKVTFHRNYNSNDAKTKSQTFTQGVSGNQFNVSWSRSGYTLSGWKFSDKEKVYKPDSIVTDDWINKHSPSTDLYAVWEKNTPASTTTTMYLCRDGYTCLNAVADYNDCSSDIYSSSSNPTSVEIKRTSGKYSVTNSGYYIWTGCLRSTKKAAKTDCVSTCIG